MSRGSDHGVTRLPSRTDIQMYERVREACYIECVKECIMLIQDLMPSPPPPALLLLSCTVSILLQIHLHRASSDKSRKEAA